METKIQSILQSHSVSKHMVRIQSVEVKDFETDTDFHGDGDEAGTWTVNF